jgi:DNA-binding transcriptional MerR regulator
MRWRRRKPKRRGYIRPSRAKPKVGWTARQLADLSGTALRTIRSYLQRGVLPRSPFRGPATRYDRRQLLWLLGIRRLRARERLELAEVRARLAALSPAELEAFATAQLAPGKLAEALGVRPATASAARAPLALGAPSSAHAAVPRWARVELALGLELHVRDDASPRVLALAQRLREVCAQGDQEQVDSHQSIDQRA